MTHTADRGLRPVRPVMSFPWLDGKPQRPPVVRHSLEHDSETLHLFFGDTHGHSKLSADSWYHTPQQYFRYGRDVARLDFCALTDHDAPLSLARFPRRWRRAVQAVRKCHRPGRFVIFHAFEWTSGTPEGSMQQRIPGRDRWGYLEDPKHFGHRNVYFPGDEVPDHVFSHDDPDYDTPEKLWSAMAPFGAVSIPHHPLGGPVCPFDWDHFNPECEPVVEIYSTHGSSVHGGCRHEIYNPYLNGKHSVRAALDRGLMFGFMASSDTHLGLAGNSTLPDPNISFSQWYFKGRHRPPGPGIAAVYARNLSREAVFEALRARRCYALTGDRIVLDVRANGRFMGESFKAADAVEISIHVKAPAPVHSVEIVKNGCVSATFHEHGTEARIDFSDPHRSTPRDYIYVRVLLRNAHMAWSSPVWITA